MELFIIIALPLVAALICSLSRVKRSVEFVTIVASVASFGAALVMAQKVARLGLYSPVPYFSVDAIGMIIVLLVTGIGCAAAIYSAPYFQAEVHKQIVGFRRVRQYFILFNLFLTAMVLAVTTTSPVMMWMFIEATTLSTAFLISFYHKPSALEAAWKYLMINSVGLLLSFFGTLLYFTAIPLADRGSLVNWDTLISNISSLDPFIAKVAFIFVLIGYGTKIGFFPMHTWKPDAYSKASSPIGALFSGALLPVVFFAALKFKFLTDMVVGAEYSRNLFTAFGMMSIAVAALIIFTQVNYKRLLAYSTIEHAGVMAIGFGLGGIAATAALLHMIYHSLVKSALFFSAGNLFLKYSSTKIVNVRDAITLIPFTSVLLVLGFLASTGVPPFGLFFTEMYILLAAIKAFPVIAVAMLVCFAVIFAGFLKHVSAMLFGTAPEGLLVGEVSPWLMVSPVVLLAMVVVLTFHPPVFIVTLLNAALVAPSL